MEKDAQDVVQGYVDGVNERLVEINADASLLPFEFVVLGLTPEPWTANQILAFIAYLLRLNDPEALKSTQLDNAAMFTRLSRIYGEETAWEMFNDLRWTWDPAANTAIDYGVRQRGKSGSNTKKSSKHATRKSSASNIKKSSKRATSKSSGSNTKKSFKRATSKSSSSNTKKSSKRATSKSASKHKSTRRTEMIDIRSEIENLASEMKETRERVFDKLERVNALVKLGSYGFVLSGDYTESRNPILYAASQLEFDAPSYVAEGSIRAGGLHASGEIIPGIPMIVDTVRTPYNAWSFEVGNAHTTDFYFEDASTVALHRVETIVVMGQDDAELPVYRGRGPVVIEFGDTFITWKYSHWNYELQTIGTFLKMLRATSIDEFEVGVNGLSTCVHILYADRDGNIAYWMAGRDPVRSPGEWRLPQGFLNDAIEWDAAVIKPNPTDRNTRRGWYGEWNNKADVNYLTGFNAAGDIQGPFHPVHVIYDYLDKVGKAKGRLTFNQTRDLALNVAGGDGGSKWFFVKEYFSRAVNRIGRTGPRADALKLLNAWDGHYVAGGEAFWVDGTEIAEAWVLQNFWIIRVLIMVFFDELELAVPDGEGNFECDECFAVMFNALLHGLEYPGSLTNSYDWFKNLDDALAPQDADTIIVEALDQVLSDWDTYSFSRGYITYSHNLLGEVWRTPALNRGTYDQIVEMGPNGPVRIERYVTMSRSCSLTFALVLLVLAF